MRWVLDDATERRALEASAHGLFGFRKGDGLVREAHPRTLDGLASGERLSETEALTIVRGIARALAYCERTGLFAGPLRPSGIALTPPCFRADALLAAWTGTNVLEPDPSPRWSPPEQIDGAPWDHAANRYVLGLAAYRMLAGKLPFAGEGLRRDAAARSDLGAPPFEDETKRSLTPGVESFVLRLLAPTMDERPASAAAIVKACDGLLGEARRTQLAPIPRALEPRKKKAPRVRREVPLLMRIRRAAPILAGVGVASVALAGAQPQTPTKRPALREVSLAGTEPQDCGTCHVREVAEWKRSVMAHSVKSPLYGALESAVEEQIGKSARCPNGAGILRNASFDVCTERSGVAQTGSGGEGWCINCHAPGENIRPSVPAWSATRGADTRAPLRDLISSASREGVSCIGCHATVGPVGPHTAGGRYQGNPTWTSFLTGQRFFARPEDDLGTPGISNSGYKIDTSAFLATTGSKLDPGQPHLDPSQRTRDYQKTSEFCGACHDVRLFGTDAVGVATRGEHFKRLRNAYTEWKTWADGERRAGRTAASCQDCHMSRYPGVCAPHPGEPASTDCPAGTRFEARAPGRDPQDIVHYFTSVDIPLTHEYPDAFANDRTLDARGTPLGLRARRDIMLRHTFRFTIENPRRAGDRLEIPLVIANVGAGHRVPAGFSQEREIWVRMEVRDAKGALVYEVGGTDLRTRDLKDKIFLRVATNDDRTDFRGRPLGVFGADVIDGPDVGRWSPSPSLGGTFFRGSGLVNFQNGFLRCVRCIGAIDENGQCQPTPDQGHTRADRFDDGFYDLDTGACTSNLTGGRELFETYYPVGALDADRGIVKAPDAIIDTRSLPPNVPVTYNYDLDAKGFTGPFSIKATLEFRSFPPFLVRAFADYEAQMAQKGLRPSGAQVTSDMLDRLDIIDLARAEVSVP